jgi:hypothetical protein
MHRNEQRAGALAGAADPQIEPVAEQLDKPNIAARGATQVVHRKSPAEALSVYSGQEHVAIILIRGRIFSVLIGGKSVGAFSNQKAAVAAAIVFAAGRFA